MFWVDKDKYCANYKWGRVGIYKYRGISEYYRLNRQISFMVVPKFAKKFQLPRLMRMGKAIIQPHRNLKL